MKGSAIARLGDGLTVGGERHRHFVVIGDGGADETKGQTGSKSLCCRVAAIAEIIDNHVKRGTRRRCIWQSDAGTPNHLFDLLMERCIGGLITATLALKLGCDIPMRRNRVA